MMTFLVLLASSVARDPDPVDAGGVCSETELTGILRPHRLVDSPVRTIDCTTEACFDEAGWISTELIIPRLTSTSTEGDYEPILLKGTHVQSWRAVREGWTAHTLAKLAPKFKFEVKSGKSSEKYERFAGPFGFQRTNFLTSASG